MRSLRILNFVAFLFIFTPFFQMCSDEKMTSSELVGPLTSTADSLASEVSQEPKADLAVPPKGANEKNLAEKFWELITIPGDNFTTTGFGLFVLAVFEVLDGNPENIWIGSLLDILSIVLTLSGLVRLFKNKVNGLLTIQILNLSTIILLFGVAVLTLDFFYQIKWGFYGYLIVNVALFFKSKQFLSPQLSRGSAPAVG